MKKVKTLLPYIVVLLVLFYFVPLLNYMYKGIAIFLLLVVMPLTVFVGSVWYGIKNSLNLLLSISTAVLFAPTIFIYYNSSASIYIFAYWGISLVGNFLGVVIKKSPLIKKKDGK